MSEWAHVFFTKTSFMSYMWNVYLMSYMRNMCLYVQHISIRATYIYMWNMYLHMNEHMSFSQKQVACHICETYVWCHICETYIYTRSISLHLKHISICETCIYMWMSAFLFHKNKFHVIYVKHTSAVIYVKDMSIRETYVCKWNVYTWNMYLMSYMWNICLYVEHISIRETYLYMWKMYPYLKHISICETCL